MCVIATFNHLRSKPSWQHFWNAWVRKPSKGFVPKSLVGEDQRREDGNFKNLAISNLQATWDGCEKKPVVNHGRFQLPFPQLVRQARFLNHQEYEWWHLQVGTRNSWRSFFDLGHFEMPFGSNPPKTDSLWGKLIVVFFDDQSLQVRDVFLKGLY